MLEINNITKSYGKRIVLKNIRLKVNDSSIITITGNSGAGKSTLLNIIAGLEKPDNGEIFFDGMELTRKGFFMNWKLYRHIIGYMFQNYALLPDQTVMNNLKIATKYRENKDNCIYSEALEIVGLNDKYLPKPIYELSGGEQQRIALARLWLKPAKLVLADEPTGNLDSYNTQVVFDVLKNFSQNGRTVVIVTHDIENAKKLGYTYSLT